MLRRESLDTFGRILGPKTSDLYDTGDVFGWYEQCTESDLLVFGATGQRSDRVLLRVLKRELDTSVGVETPWTHFVREYILENRPSTSH